MTQTAAAGKFKCAQSLISQMENEETQPGIDYLAWLAEEAGVSTDWLITGKERPPKSEPRASVYPLGEEDKNALTAAESLLKWRGLEDRYAVTEVHPPQTTEDRLNQEEKRLLEAFRQLDRKIQEALLIQAEMTAEGLKKSAKKEPHGGGLMEAI